MKPKYYYSAENFEKYKPRISGSRSICRLFRKQKPRRGPVGGPAVDLRNPYAKQAAKKYWRARLAVSALALATAAWLGVLLYWPPFTIDKIAYVGLNFIKKNDIDGFVRGNFLTRRWWWPRDNYFLLSAKGIEGGLMENYSLNSATVKKIFPRELRIDVEEKITSIVYDNGFQYFLLDNEGRAIKYLAEAGNPEQHAAPDMPIEELLLLATSTPPVSASSTAPATTTPAAASAEKTHRPEYRKIRKDFGAYLIVYDARNRLVSEGQEDILPPKFIQAMIDWSDLLGREGIGDVRYVIIVEHPLAGAAVHTERPWLVYFQPAGDLSAQMMNLKALLLKNKPQEYIDLRFGERVFWK